MVLLRNRTDVVGQTPFVLVLSELLDLQEGRRPHLYLCARPL